MMNVGIMWREVYKDDNDLYSIGKQMISNWHHKKKSLKAWRASANFIYVFRFGDSERILRVVPDSERKTEQILAEIDYVTFLRSQGLPVLLPLESKEGELVVSDENENGLFHAVVYERAPGAYIEFEALTKKHWLECGRMMARVHSVALDFKPNSKRKRRTWKQDINLAISKLYKEDQEIVAILQHFKTKVKELLEKQFYCLIHYDLCYDNIIWNENSYVIIDFDDAAYYPMVADVAFGIDDIRELPETKAEKVLNWFVSGYSEFKSLPENWKEQLEFFFDLEDAIKFARTKYAYNGTNPALYPEWLIKLRQRHFTSMQKEKERLTKKWKEIL